MNTIATQIIRQVAQSIWTIAINWLVSTLVGIDADQRRTSLDWHISQSLIKTSNEYTHLLLKESR